VNSTKTDEPIELPFGLWTRMGHRKHVFGGAGMPQGKGNCGDCSPALKCIRLCKQQTPQLHGAADLSAGDSASRRKGGFVRNGFNRRGVTSAGEAMRPFVTIL